MTGQERFSHRLLLIAVLMCFSNLLQAAEDKDSSGSSMDLVGMSLEELLDIEVTSVSKKKEKLHAAAAAVYVLTEEDIRRSGASNIPDLLRLVPGLSVARLDASSWSVTSRGFSGRYAQRLLVLIDGRSVYTPLFSGVEWEARHVFLENIERIEIIRGPGGTLWGANAVNGVINIVTKEAKDTQGGLLSVGAGTEEKAFGAFRYGGHLPRGGYYRFYAEYFDRDDGKLERGNAARDEWELSRSGFRVDWDLANDDRLTLEGDLFATDVYQTFALPSLIPPFERLERSEMRYCVMSILFLH